MNTPFQPTPAANFDIVFEKLQEAKNQQPDCFHIDLENVQLTTDAVMLLKEFQEGSDLPVYTTFTKA